MNMTSDQNQSKQKTLGQLPLVKDGGYCVGCGACAVGLGTEMHLNDYGEYEPDFSSVNPSSINYQTEEIESLCPFLSPELNENVLAKSRFESGAKHHDKIGIMWKHMLERSTSNPSGKMALREAWARGLEVSSCVWA